MAAVALACIFAASMTSEANRKYLVNSVRIWSGDDTKTVNYNDDSNEVTLGDIFKDKLKNFKFED